MHRRNILKTFAIAAVSPNIFNGIDSAGWSVLNSDFYPSTGNPDEMLWYNYPGQYWNSQSMHIGNGFLGLSFLGGVSEEIFCVTEKTVWTGGPGESADTQYGIKPGGKTYLPEIRRLMVSNTIEDLKTADKLVEDHFMGDSRGYGYFSAFGRLSFVFDHSSKEYFKDKRSLDLSRSVANIEYEVNGTRYSREYFCSHPDRVAVMKFSADKKNSISFRMKWDVFQKDSRVVFRDHLFELSGTINKNDRQFSVKMQIQVSQGTISRDNNDIVVNDANEVIIILSAATDYLPLPPSYKGANPFEITSAYINSAKAKEYAVLLSKHIQDYQRLYNRVSLKISSSINSESLPTNERWARYKTSKSSDPAFKVLYFNLGRYLLISSSRPGALPANLQGGWNIIEKAPWSGNYQSNVNLQLNYSSACSTNLAECLVPYLDWIKNLVIPGREAAKAYYGTEGWVSHAIGNIWGYSAPGFGLSWGIYPAGAAWHCHFIWKYFEYTQNRDYLKKTAYPILKDASVFWMQNLVKYRGGLMSAPSGSAEHGALVLNGKLISTGTSSDKAIINLPGNFQDVQMIRELFLNTVKAAKVLNEDAEFIKTIEHTNKKLLPYKIGQYGQLQEWEEDIDNPASNHRHIAHLYALWPGKEISPDTNTGLANAARKSLDMRGEARLYKNETYKDIFSASNWSLAHRLGCWLRLRDAERANKIFTQLIIDSGFENLLTFQQTPLSFNAYPKNQPDLYYLDTPEGLWTPVWQVDASMAIPGFIAEMLLQSRNEHVYLLPALPQEFLTGEIKGLRSEGGLIIDVKWVAGKVISYKVASTVPQKIKLHVNGTVKEIVCSRI